MNVKENNTSNIPWAKVAIIVAAFVLLAMFSGRAGIEEILGLKAGTLGGPVVEENDQQSASSNPVVNGNANEKSHRSNSGREPEEPFEFKESGYVMESPEGLTYYVGDRGENRMEHVMRHAKDQPNRNVHSVFTGGETDIFQTIDEAYALIKSNSSQVLVENKVRDFDTRMEYEVDMKRKIGFKGGQSGQRDGKPALHTLKLILDKGNAVITAYPYR